MLRYLDKTAVTYVLLGALIIVFLSTEPSLAQEPNFKGIERFLQAIVEAITGGIGKAIAALAVMGVGFSFMMGHMDWTYAAAVVLGIAVVFGGATLVSTMTAI